MAWYLKGYSNHKHSHCEACGKEITHNWFIFDGETVMRVGSECMGQYLVGTKKVHKHISMAQALLRKHGLNNANWGGEAFSSFWVDYYVNAALCGARVSNNPKYVFYNYWMPYTPYTLPEEPEPYLAF